MLYFSFLTAAPIGGKEATFTLRHYVGFFTKSIYWYNAWRSIELGLYVTATCLILLAYPAALGLAKVVKGRWREAIFLLIILPFWSNALVRTFSWTMVLRAAAGYPVHLSRRSSSGWSTPICPMPSSPSMSRCSRSTIP